jgi:hypothetical protein
MPRVGFKPTILIFEWEKEFRALDSAATVIGRVLFNDAQAATKLNRI